MGLSNESKAVSTPGAPTTDEEDGKEVGAEDRACYRSWTMRASYLSHDRCELQFAVEELARRMQQPTHNVVATSSIEAEFYALPKSVRRELWAQWPWLLTCRRL